MFLLLYCCIVLLSSHFWRFSHKSIQH